MYSFTLATKSRKKLTKNTTFSIYVLFHFLRPSYLTFYDYSRTLNNLGGVVPYCTSVTAFTQTHLTASRCVIVSFNGYSPAR